MINTSREQTHNVVDFMNTCTYQVLFLFPLMIYSIKTIMKTSTIFHLTYIYIYIYPGIDAKDDSKSEDDLP